MAIEAHHISVEARAKERAVLYPVVADVGMTTLLLIVAAATGSLTILSEGIRSVLMLGASIYGLVVLRSMHRDRLRRFEFGVEKIEQFVSLVIGVGLVISGLWLAHSVVDRVFSGEAAASPLGLAMAAAVNGINTVLNSLGWLAMRNAARHEESEVYSAQLNARLVMMTSSIFLQVTLTIAALAKDPGLALLLDAAGAAFVAGLMIVKGGRMVLSAMPVLLDSPVAQRRRAAIAEAVARFVASEDLVSLRVRRTGASAVAEVVLSDRSQMTAIALRDLPDRIASAAAGDGAEIEVTVGIAARREAGAPEGGE